MNAAKKTAEKPAEKAPAKPTKKAAVAAAEKPVSAPGVNEGRLMTVLLAPVISEKATFIADKHNQVIFRVRQDATKKDVKAAVELVWKDKKVEVESVQIVNVRGKAKRFGAYAGRRRNWKKAYVSLKPGQEINFAQEA
jgi:large subunit ribosomal protein L23